MSREAELGTSHLEMFQVIQITHPFDNAFQKYMDLLWLNYFQTNLWMSFASVKKHLYMRQGITKKGEKFEL